MPFVLDPSFAGPWFLPDEANATADEYAKRLETDIAVITALS